MFKLLLFNFIIVNVCAFKVFFFFFMWKHSVKCSPRFLSTCLCCVYVCLPVHAMFTTCLCVCACPCHVYHSANVEGRRRLMEAGFLLLPRGFWGLKPGPEAWHKCPHVLSRLSFLVSLILSNETAWGETHNSLSLFLSLFFLRINLCFMK